MTFCRGAASCLRPADFVAKQFGASEGRHREQTCSVAFGSCVCVSLQWSAARADEAYAVAGGVAEFEGDRRSAHLSGREIYRVSSARNGLEGKCLRAADLAGERGDGSELSIDTRKEIERRAGMVAGWTVVGVYRGAGNKCDHRRGARGEERRERQEEGRERREKRGGREAGGAADLGDLTGWRRGVAVDAAGNGYRRISLVEGWEADCVYGAERGKQEREGAQGKVQRLRSV